MSEIEELISNTEAHSQPELNLGDPQSETDEEIDLNVAVDNGEAESESDDDNAGRSTSDTIEEEIEPAVKSDDEPELPDDNGSKRSGVIIDMDTT